MKTSREIHDMIQRFDLAGHPELVTSRILDVLDALNRRMDYMETELTRTANTVSCLANGIKPD